MKKLTKKEEANIKEILKDTDEIFGIIDELDAINIEEVDIKKYEKKLDVMKDRIDIKYKKYQKYQKNKNIKDNLDSEE